MPAFKRARSAEQKQERMREIKRAAADLFATRPYHEITLTTIAEQLSWSRANLYKYVTTKEEIFLALAEDERDAYYHDLLVAFPEGLSFELHEAAVTWAGVMDPNREWFRVHDLLFAIIETNVSLERLVAFKRGYFEQMDVLRPRLSAATGIPAERVEYLMNTLHYHAIGLLANCCTLSQVREALAELGVPYKTPDFPAEMREFTEMCLQHELDRLNT